MKYLKEKVKNNFSKKNVRRLKNFYQDIKAFGFGFNLSKLGKIYGTDKIGGHFYTQHYQKHFRDFKFKKIKLLEIGVGGYEKPDSGATSLRMWKKYFPFGKIYAIDIYDKSLLQEKRIKIFKGSQIDVPFLDKCIDEIGSLDLIVDDGSHINEHVIKTFNILFPKLKDGGIYVVEDTQTSYWKSYGGDSYDLNNSKTMMNYFKSLTDCLNNKEFLNPTYIQTYFDKKIISIHFYHNLIFIYKGNNDEESMWVKNNSK